VSNAALRARYVSDAVTTASPARLVVMLYERLVLDLRTAEEALTATPPDRSEATGRLIHAQQIVLELISGLDTTAWSGGPGLVSIYVFLSSELAAANIAADAARVVTCRQLVEPLRDAWREAAARIAAGASGTASGTAPDGAPTDAVGGVA
jgi:flagellar protein FliS